MCSVLHWSRQSADIELGSGYRESERKWAVWGVKRKPTRCFAQDLLKGYEIFYMYANGNQEILMQKTFLTRFENFNDVRITFKISSNLKLRNETYP